MSLRMVIIEEKDMYEQKRRIAAKTVVATALSSGLSADKVIAMLLVYMFSSTLTLYLDAVKTKLI